MTFGFLVEEGKTAVIIASDTGPTREIWEKARSLPGLRAVFLDASFPNSPEQLAEISKHLTPSLFAAEVKKIDGDVLLFAVHIKAFCRQQVVQELESLEIPGLEIASPGTDYQF